MPEAATGEGWRAPGRASGATAPGSPARSRRRAARWAPAAVVVGVTALGTFLHLWYLFHLPLNSDQAVAGLMARRMLNGHFTAFYYGQAYGGSAEEVVLAALGGLLGFSALTVNGSVALFSAVAAVLTWRIGLRLVADGRLAALAGALTWAAPLSAVSNGTYAYGFRAMTTVCGTAAVLLALRQLDGHRSPPEFAAFGAAAGLGWWSSPEMAYFLVPAAIVVVQGFLRHRRATPGRLLAAQVVAGTASFVVAALPWIWANASSGVASLRSSSLHQAPGAPDLIGRLRLYPRFVLPMTFGLRGQYSGSWLGGRSVGMALYLVAAALLLAALAAAVLMGGRHLALAAGVVVFPLLLAASPASANWESGRYAIFNVPLVWLVLAVGADRLGRRDRPGWRPSAAGRHRGGPARDPAGPGSPEVGRLVAGGVAVALSVIVVAGFAHVARNPGTRWWSSPDDPSLPAMRALQAAGVTVGYADYWVAYRLDLLSGGKLRLTVGSGDPRRDPGIDAAVRRAPTAAWVFVGLDSLTLTQFGATGRIQGPDGISEATFLDYLVHHQVPFGRLRAGIMQAVVPARQVTPEQVAGGGRRQ